MRNIFYIFFFYCFFISAQTDKIIFKNGEILKGSVKSMGNDFVFFKENDTSDYRRFSKSNILLIEKYDGIVYVFGGKNEPKDSSVNRKIKYRNSIGAQPFNILLGRYTFSYERLNKNGSIGYLFPVSITYDPVGSLYAPDTSRKTTSSAHRSGVNIIAGADVNFYIGKNDFEGFYIGPRVRYGVDMFLQNIEAYTIQTQFGWKLNDQEDRLTQHISVGFGFVRILSSQANNRFGPKQSFGWGSINYRVGFNW